MLIIGRKPRYMLWIAIATAIINAIFDALFYLLLGPIGIVLSTVMVRWIMAGVYLHLLRTVVPATIGQEATPD
jgi:peptidoglycan biosynthesis protein MviN/MurJ (putative lipid II flippase)